MRTQRRTRLSAATLVLGLGVALLLGPLAPPAAAATPAPSLDSTFSSLLNGLRSTLGLGALSVDPTLSSVARNWSINMASSGTLHHNPSLSSQVSGWQKLGENVGTGVAVTQIFNALVASPVHMRNMSDRDFTRIGVGSVTDSKARVWTTHVFMRPMSGGAPAPAPAPAAAAAAPAATPAPKAAPAPAAAPRPAPTTAAPTTAPPTTAGPTTAPLPATAAPVPAAAAAAGTDTPTEAPAPVVDPAPASTTSSSQSGPPTPLLAGAALLGLLVLGGAGLVLRRLTSGRRRRLSAGPPEDLSLALDLGR